MKKWLFPLTKEMYELVESGEKTMEGRVSEPSNPKKNYLLMNIGDTIIFECLETKRRTKTKVVYKKHYKNVEECLNEQGLEKMLPGVNSIEEGINLYNNFPGYKERIKRFGIYAISFEKLRE
jgi:ASC-1-like (ASCH) protein